MTNKELRRKPLQVYLNNEERAQLEETRLALNCKSYSRTITKALRLIWSLRAK